ncbi:MAG: type II toxin-antitoxin system VapC family toxin [Thaumarchaeota archaeon]|nr:type II toxin-antitoxin system VapC family toxin [Nitrososphaerota archaeon]
MKKKAKGWRLADSIVYSTGLVKKARIVTGDEHFKNLENALFIG